MDNEKIKIISLYFTSKKKTGKERTIDSSDIIMDLD